MGREDSFLICDEKVHVVVYDPERAEPVCSKCGLVLDDARLDFALEFDAVPKARATKRRRPCPTISETSKRSLEHSSLERNLQDMFLKKTVQKFVQEKVLELCRAVREQRLYRGYPLSTLSSAVIYTAHRLCRVPVTLGECAVKSATERKRVARCYEKLCQELELNVPRFESVDYLSHLAKKKGIDDDTLTLASKTLRRAKEKHLVKGSNPIGIAAAVLYFACNVTGTRITQKELASAATVSEATVRISFKKLRAFFKLQHVCEQRV